MKRFGWKAILVLVLVFAIGVGIGVSSAKKNKAEPKQEAAAEPAPSGIIIVDAPDAEPTEQLPEGLILVSPPVDYSPNGGSSSYSGGIEIVDPPAGAPGSGITIVDPPQGSGITVVDPPSGQPSGTTIKSGSFASSTGTNLNIHANYTVVISDSNTVAVTVSSSLSHSNLTANSASVTYSCDGQSGSVGTPSINGSGPTSFGSKTFYVPLSAGQSKTISIGASWPFNGTYSGVLITTVSGSTSVTISR